MRITESDYVGDPVDDVVAALQTLSPDFSINRDLSRPATTPEQVGLVYQVNPVGEVAPDADIDVLAYGDYPPPVAPAKPAVGSTTVVEGDTGTLTWSEYGGCPAGHPLSHYEFSVSGATPSINGAIDPANPREMELSFDTAGTVTVTYTASCQGDPLITSPASEPLTITVNPA